MVIFFKLKNVLLILPPKYAPPFVLVDFYQLCFCHAPDDFFKAHLEAPSWFNIEMTKSCRIQGESVHLLAYSVNSTCCAERLELTPEKPESLDQPQRCLDRLLRALGQPLRGLSQSLWGLDQPRSGLSQALRGLSHPLRDLLEPLRALANHKEALIDTWEAWASL